MKSHFTINKGYCRRSYTSFIFKPICRVTLHAGLRHAPSLQYEFSPHWLHQRNHQSSTGGSTGAGSLGPTGGTGFTGGGSTGAGSLWPAGGSTGGSTGSTGAGSLGMTGGAGLALDIASAGGVWRPWRPVPHRSICPAWWIRILRSLEVLAHLLLLHHLLIHLLLLQHQNHSPAKQGGDHEFLWPP